MIILVLSLPYSTLRHASCIIAFCAYKQIMANASKRAMWHVVLLLCYAENAEVVVSSVSRGANSGHHFVITASSCVANAPVGTTMLPWSNSK